MRIVKSFPFIITFAIAAIIAGCDKQKSAGSGGASSSDKVTIGYIVKLPDQPWFQNEWKFAQQAADKDGFDLEKMGGEDGSKVLSDIDRLGTMQAQGLVICTPDPLMGPAIMSRAAKYNIKVYSVDDQFQDTDGKVMDEHHMGISAREIGHLVGKALWDEMQKRGWKPEDTAAEITTHSELQTHLDRTDGAIEALVAAGFPKEKIYTCPQKSTEISGGFDAANIVLVQHQEVKNWLTAGINDEAVLGAVRAMEGHGITADHIIGVGIGGDTGVSDFQKPQATGFFASVLISPKRHGFEATENMFKWIHDGVEPPKLTLTTGILITRENYQQVRKEQGLD